LRIKKLSLVLSLLVFAVIGGSSLDATNDANPKGAFRKGRRLYKKSDYIQAAPFLKEAYNLDPENAKYAYMLGRSVFEGDQPAQALSYFVAAYNLDQGVSEDINYYLGRSMHLNLLFEDAITHYQADLSRLDPESWVYDDTQMRIEQCKNAPKTIKKVVNYKVENLGEYVNTPYPEYSSTFSNDYQYMIFTTRKPRKVKQLSRRRYHVEDINEEVYEANYSNGTWIKSKLFRKPIPTWTHDASINLSEDGNTLIYYVDNRNNGDIYISKRDGDEWGKRMSIGENVNTKDYTECSAFITADGKTLYWVSNKPDGQGHKDMYKSTLDAGGKWSEGTNLGSKVNTAYDEDAPFVTPDGKKLYFSSRGHNSMGGFDLFMCELQPDGSWGAPENLGTPINSVGDDIYLVWKNGSKGFYFSSDRPGGYGEKDIYFASPFTPADNKEATIVAGTVLDKATGKPVAAEVKLLDKNTNEVLGTATTKPENGGKYSFQLPTAGQEYKLEIKVEAGEGVIPVASEVGKYNVVSGSIKDALDNRPLDAVVELVDPATGKTVDMMPTNPKTGNYMFPVQSGKKYTIRVKANEYLPYVEDFSVAASGQLESHYEEIAMQKLTEANKIVITWQFFDVDKHLIKADYIKDLENVVNVMNKVPNMKLNIIGHTDSDADEKYNQELSENRAKSVAKYLTDRGIDPMRINTSGMGETMPIYPNDNPESKRYNRRVELYIIE
jgi:outer membrane protein OmpA-like peptidoglycan-associated protein/tetratricopeptide (TPR) repeat protein